MLFATRLAGGFCVPWASRHLLKALLAQTAALALSLVTIQLAQSSSVPNNTESHTLKRACKHVSMLACKCVSV